MRLTEASVSSARCAAAPTSAPVQCHTAAQMFYSDSILPGTLRGFK